MSLSARRGACAALLLAALFLVACEQITPTPRPTRTLAVATEVVVAADTSTVTPTAAVTPTVARATPLPTSGLAPTPAANDPLLPVLGPFPPKPIPSRPSNINPLTGLTADPAMLQRRPIVVRIGNDAVVPQNGYQAGLSMADLVFEELIDVKNSSYAATRYSAVFLSKDPPLIGPIRSERIVNFQIVPMLDGALVSAGGSGESPGSPGTRWLFSLEPIVNLDEYFNQSAYCYIERGGKFAYTSRLYTSGPRLREYMASSSPPASRLGAYNGTDLIKYMQQLKLESAVPLYGFSFSDRPASGQKATAIGFSKAPWPSAQKASWEYDAGSGSYLRSSSGVALTDNSYPVTAKWGNGAHCAVSGPATQTPVSAANVVVLYAKHEPTDIREDNNDYMSVHITLTGEGQAQFFRDGVMVDGKWQRQSEQEFFNFVDASGNPVDLKPGTTWFEIVPTGYQLDLK